MTFWPVAHQTPLSVGSFRQENWSGMPFPSPWDIPDLGMEHLSPELTGEFFTTEPLETSQSLLTFIDSCESLHKAFRAPGPFLILG